MTRAIRVLAVLSFAAAAMAQAPTTFREGVLAFEKQEWARAEQLMRQTVAVNPNESVGTVSISGQWFETYVPYYFLARALAKQGKCTEALAAFAETERQGVSPTIDDFARHLKSRGGCKGKKEITIEVPLATTTVAPPRKDKPVVVTPPPPRSKEKPIDVPSDKPRPDPAIRARLSAAVSAYLGGRYEETLQLLANRNFPDRAAAAEAALFRAAAQHALYRIGGERDAALRAAVERDLALYRNLRPNGRPDPRVFPPAFLALFGVRRP